MTLGRLYTIEDNVASVTSGAALLAGTLPSDLCVEVIEAHITDVDNDTSEQFEGSLQQATGTAAGGASVTPAVHITTDTATSVTFLSASGAAITGLTITGRDFGRQSQPLIVGWHYTPIDGTGPIFSPSAIMVVQTTTSITSSTLSVRLVYKEIGG